MFELEVYAVGIRNTEKILLLDRELELVTDIRYKVDTNHDLVYMEFDRPTLSLQEIRQIFRRLEIEPRFVGHIPEEIRLKQKTQRIA